MTTRTFSDNRKPAFTVLGGMMYDREADLGSGRRYSKLRYSGENYAYTRLYETVMDGRTFMSALYTKMPVCIFQYEDEAIGLKYSPVVGGQIPSVSVWSDDEGCHFGYTSEITHATKSKDRPHMGAWLRTGEYRADIDELPKFERIEAKTWWEVVRRFVESELDGWDDPLPAERIRDVLAMSNAFHNRIFDAVNCLHVDTVLADRPGRYDDHVYSFPSFESCRVMSLFRYDAEANRARCKGVAGRLVCDETLSAELKELGPYRVWHNGYITPSMDSRLVGCTTFGTGYSGYPGGMGTLLRKLLEFAEASGSAELLPNLRKGANWLLLVQNPDGSFPFTVPSLADHSSAGQSTVTGPNAKALGGGAEAARALYWAYRVFGDDSYLKASERAVKLMNPEPPFYGFRGYGDLRDSSPYETDATSGIQLASANLELYEATGNNSYLKAAEILAHYLLTWHDWWRCTSIDPYGFIDPMIESFSPHISPWNTALASELYSRLYAATSDGFWQKLAEFSFARASSLVNPSTGGISETYPLKMVEEITNMGGESGMVTWGILDAGCAILNNRNETFVTRRDGESSGQPVTDGIKVGAVVELIRPSRPKPSLKGLLRPLKPWIKVLMKKVLGPRGVAMLATRKTMLEPPAPLSSGEGETTSVAFGMGEGVRENISFTSRPGNGALTLRLAALEHDTRLRFVYMPVIDFDSEITRVETVGRVGETITALDVSVADRRVLRIEFMDGTTGLGVSQAEARGRRLMCDVTLKAGWQFGGECLQVVRITEIGGSNA